MTRHLTTAGKVTATLLALGVIACLFLLAFEATKGDPVGVAACAVTAVGAAGMLASLLRQGDGL